MEFSQELDLSTVGHQGDASHANTPTEGRSGRGGTTPAAAAAASSSSRRVLSRISTVGTASEFRSYTATELSGEDLGRPPSTGAHAALPQLPPLAKSAGLSVLQQQHHHHRQKRKLVVGGDSWSSFRRSSRSSTSPQGGELAPSLSVSDADFPLYLRALSRSSSVDAQRSTKHAEDFHDALTAGVGRGGDDQGRWRRQLARRLRQQQQQQQYPYPREREWMGGAGLSQRLDRLLTRLLCQDESHVLRRSRQQQSANLLGHLFSRDVLRQVGGLHSSQALHRHYDWLAQESTQRQHQPPMPWQDRQRGAVVAGRSVSIPREGQPVEGTHLPAGGGVGSREWRGGTQLGQPYHHLLEGHSPQLPPPPSILSSTAGQLASGMTTATSLSAATTTTANVSQPTSQTMADLRSRAGSGTPRDNSQDLRETGILLRSSSTSPHQGATAAPGGRRSLLLQDDDDPPQQQQQQQSLPMVSFGPVPGHVPASGSQCSSPHVSFKVSGRSPVRREDSRDWQSDDTFRKYSSKDGSSLEGDRGSAARATVATSMVEQVSVSQSKRLPEEEELQQENAKSLSRLQQLSSLMLILGLCGVACFVVDNEVYWGSRTRSEQSLGSNTLRIAQSTCAFFLVVCLACLYFFHWKIIRSRLVGRALFWRSKLPMWMAAEIVLCAAHIPPFVTATTGSGWVFVGLCQFSRLYIVLHVIVVFHPLFRTSDSWMLSLETGPVGYAFLLKDILDRFPIRVLLAFLACAIPILAYCIYLSGRNEDPRLDSYSGSLFLAFVSMTTIGMESFSNISHLTRFYIVLCAILFVPSALALLVCIWREFQWTAEQAKVINTLRLQDLLHKQQNHAAFVIQCSWSLHLLRKSLLKLASELQALHCAIEPKTSAFSLMHSSSFWGSGPGPSRHGSFREVDGRMVRMSRMGTDLLFPEGLQGSRKTSIQTEEVAGSLSTPGDIAEASMQLNDGLSSAMEGIEGQEKWGQSSQWRAQALQVEIRNVDRMLCDGYTLQCRQLSLFHDTCMKTLEVRASLPMLCTMMQLVGDSVCSAEDVANRLDATVSNVIVSAFRDLFIRASKIEQRHDDLVGLCVSMLENQHQSDARIGSVLHMLQELKDKLQ